MFCDFSLRIPLSHESVEVRATALRTLRCVLSEAADAVAANIVSLHHLVVRCLDIDLDNQARICNSYHHMSAAIYCWISQHSIYAIYSRQFDIVFQMERLQAIRLARKMLFLAPSSFPAAIVRSLVSIADGDHKE